MGFTRSSLTCLLVVGLAVPRLVFSEPPANDRVLIHMPQDTSLLAPEAPEVPESISRPVRRLKFVEICAASLWLVGSAVIGYSSIEIIKDVIKGSPMAVRNGASVRPREPAQWAARLSVVTTKLADAMDDADKVAVHAAALARHRPSWLYGRSKIAEIQSQRLTEMFEAIHMLHDWSDDDPRAILKMSGLSTERQNQLLEEGIFDGEGYWTIDFSKDSRGNPTVFSLQPPQDWIDLFKKSVNEEKAAPPVFPGKGYLASFP